MLCAKGICTGEVCFHTGPYPVSRRCVAFTEDLCAILRGTSLWKARLGWFSSLTAGDLYNRLESSLSIASRLGSYVLGISITCQLVDLLPSLAAIGLLLAFIAKNPRMRGCWVHSLVEGYTWHRQHQGCTLYLHGQRPGYVPSRNGMECFRDLNHGEATGKSTGNRSVGHVATSSMAWAWFTRIMLASTPIHHSLYLQLSNVMSFSSPAGINTVTPTLYTTQKVTISYAVEFLYGEASRGSYTSIRGAFPG